VVHRSLKTGIELSFHKRLKPLNIECLTKEKHMTILAVTTWEGSVAGLQILEVGAKQSAPLHESMGAKNPKLWRASAGGDIERAYYSIEFDSHEAYGKFSDAMIASEWWAATTEWMKANKDEIENMGTTIYYNVL